MISKKPEKIRLIWDAAATVDGVSLNSLLLKGPDQLTSLSAVLVRFRQYAIAVSADIKEMFHQIRIREADRHSQRFLWRTDPSNEPHIFSNGRSNVWVNVFASVGPICQEPKCS